MGRNIFEYIPNNIPAGGPDPNPPVANLHDRIKSGDYMGWKGDLQPYLQKALDGEKDVNGNDIDRPYRELFIPIGWYRFGSPLKISKPITVRGESFLGKVGDVIHIDDIRGLTTHLEYFGKDQAIEVTTGPVHLSTFDLFLDRADTPSNRTDGILITDTDFSSFTNLNIQSFGDPSSAGLRCRKDAVKVEFVNLNFGNNYDGIAIGDWEVYGGITALRFNNCRIMSNSNIGLVIHNLRGSTFRDCQFEGNKRKGIEISSLPSRALYQPPPNVDGTIPAPYYIHDEKIVNLGFYDCWVERNGPGDKDAVDPEIRGQIEIFKAPLRVAWKWALNDVPSNVIFHNLFAQQSYHPGSIPAIYCNFGHRCFFYHSRVNSHKEIVITGNCTSCAEVETWCVDGGQGKEKI